MKFRMIGGLLLLLCSVGMGQSTPEAASSSTIPSGQPGTASDAKAPVTRIEVIPAQDPPAYSRRFSASPVVVGHRGVVIVCVGQLYSEGGRFALIRNTPIEASIS